MTGFRDIVTRRTLLRRAAPGGVLLLAACDAAGSQGGQQPVEGPQEVIWLRQSLGEPRDTYLVQHLRRAAEATGVKITDPLESGNMLDKRLAEFASGLTNVDIIYNQLNWNLPLGLAGALIDHYPY